jgi:hypothetical protein
MKKYQKIVETAKMVNLTIFNLVISIKTFNLPVPDFP